MKQHPMSPVRISVRGRRAGGFTLIELMITVSIVAILAAIAIPSYNAYIRKSRRTDAKSALLDMASLEERYFSSNNAYSSNPTDLGYATTTPPIFISTDYTVTSANFNVTQAIAGGAGVTPKVATYSFTATPVGDQVNDTQCASFTVTSGGGQTATNSANADNTQTCWH
jgi:type IV pilus assembly protein PilE